MSKTGDRERAERQRLIRQVVNYGIIQQQQAEVMQREYLKQHIRDMERQSRSK